MTTESVQTSDAAYYPAHLMLESLDAWHTFKKQIRITTGETFYLINMGRPLAALPKYADYWDDIENERNPEYFFQVLEHSSQTIKDVSQFFSTPCQVPIS